MRIFSTADLDYLYTRVKSKYRIDFLNYAQASFERRIERFLGLHHFPNITELADKVCDDAAFFDLFIKEITVNTTEMFRDPGCWKIIREKILPLLAGLPNIRVWHAGCSSGEEIYTMTILLKELGLLEKSKIIASDINKEVIETAKTGKYSKKTLQLNMENYIKAGGKMQLSDYFNETEKDYVMSRDLMENVRFMKFDLSFGTNFSKFDLVICRNVLIYFNKELQEKVFTLFHESLFKKGFIIIGKKESMSYFSGYSSFTEFDAAEKIYQLK
ncbi:MAG: CheR family methyltransferase [Bacteroidia bacterium]